MMVAHDLAERIVELEARLDHELPPGLAASAVTPARLNAAREWSEGIWQAAVLAGPVPPAADELQRGCVLAEQPVFLCGAHRSGTTLLRNLLDGHPALLVLPAEGSYYTQLAATLAHVPPAQHARAFISEWLRRLANPINQPPYWLLGRSTVDASPYIRFARAALGWWTEIEARFAARAGQWPLIAAALAYATVRFNGLPRSLQYWVEKTPGNERFLNQLWREFPGARVIHMVRDPAAVFASRRAAEERATGTFRARGKVLRELATTYRIAGTIRGKPGPYQVVRYEDLIADPAEVMAGVARFIGIAPSAELLQPQVAALPATQNSAFAAAASSGSIGQPREPALASDERAMVAACTDKWAARLGYQQPPHGSWARRQYLKLVNGMWPARLFLP